MICSAIMLGIGIYMFVADFNSTSIVTSWRCNPSEQTISWQTPVFGAIVMLILGILIKIDKPKLPKMDIQGKRTFVFEKITDYLKENDFKKRGHHLFDLVTLNTYNSERPKNATPDLFFFGGYDWDGSQVYLTNNGKVHFCYPNDCTSLKNWDSLDEQ